MNFNDYKNEFKEINKRFDGEIATLERNLRRASEKMVRESKRFAEWLETYENTPQHIPYPLGLREAHDYMQHEIAVQRRALEEALEAERIARGHYEAVAQNKKSWIVKLHGRFRAAYIEAAMQKAEQEFEKLAGVGV